MRTLLTAVLFVLIMITDAGYSQTQQTASLLQRAANQAGNPYSHFTAIGSATRTLGSLHETGSIGISLSTPGQLDIVESWPSGTVIYCTRVNNGLRSGWRVDKDGNHPIPYHNLFVPISWMIPLALLRDASGAGQSDAADTGPEMKDGAEVEHFILYQNSGELSADASEVNRLRRADIYVDPNTGLAKSLEYKVHADNDSHLDITVRIEYDNYQTSAGALFPMHLRKLENNCLVTEISFSSITVSY